MLLYYRIPRIFKCSLLSKEVKFLKPGPAGSLQKSKRILSTSSQNEVLPSYKKKVTRIVSSDDDNGDDEFRFNTSLRLLVVVIKVKLKLPFQL
jgi:hypothetical protein